MARVTGSHLICKALQLEGVRNIFALAGDHILPVLDVMADQDFRIIDTRHEQAAVHMADAWSRITEQPGVCMYTTPGFAGGSGAGVEARFSRWETRATERRRAARDQPQSRSRHRPTQSRRIAVDLALKMMAANSIRRYIGFHAWQMLTVRLEDLFGTNNDPQRFNGNPKYPLHDMP